MSNMKCLSPFVKQCLVSATVCINVIGHGCAYGFPAVLLPHLKSTDTEESWIASSITLAMLVGNFSISVFLDRAGRRLSHFLVLIPCILGWLLIITATNVPMLIIARLLQGFSYGQLIPLRTIIIGEYTSPKNRGAFLTTISLAQTGGILLVHLFGSFLSWRNTAIACESFLVVSFIMTFLLPESPSWLANKGNYEECKKVFRYLRGDTENDELNELIQARRVYNETEGSRKLICILKSSEFYKPVTITLHVTLMMYTAGLMNLAVYGTTIIREIMGPVDPHYWLVVLDFVRIITGFLAVFLMKAFKRRTVAFSSAALCIAVHIAIVAHVVMLKRGIFVFNYVWIPALFLIIQCVSVSYGILPISNIIPGEIFPLSYRGTGIGISTAIATLVHFVILKTYPFLISEVNIEGAYSIYAGILVYCFVVLWAMMPETKGYTLQQIEDRLKGNKEKAEMTELKLLNGSKS